MILPVPVIELFDKASAHVDKENSILFRRLIGSLVSSQKARSDILYAVKIFPLFADQPPEAHPPPPKLFRRRQRNLGFLAASGAQWTGDQNDGVLRSSLLKVWWRLWYHVMGREKTNNRLSDYRPEKLIIKSWPPPFRNYVSCVIYFIYITNSYHLLNTTKVLENIHRTLCAPQKINDVDVNSIAHETQSKKESTFTSCQLMQWPPYFGSNDFVNLIPVHTIKLSRAD